MLTNFNNKIGIIVFSVIFIAFFFILFIGLVDWSSVKLMLNSPSADLKVWELMVIIFFIVIVFGK